MKAAICVVDMVKDNIREGNHPVALAQARAIIPQINCLTAKARKLDLPVIFASDSFLPGDFIFQGRMKEHAIRGTEGARVIDELYQGEGDIYVSKRRFSAFFKTDLDLTLRMLGVDGLAIAGINSHWCVLDTAFDAVSNDFYAYIISDCCASFRADVHETTMTLYRNNPLNPLFQVITLEEFEKDVLSHQR